MTTRVGNDGVVEVGATEVAELKSWSLDESAAQIEDSAMGDSNQTYKAGRKSVSGSIEVHYDDTDTAGQGALIPGSEVSLTLYPETTDVGSPRISLSATITSRSLAVQMENIISRTYQFSAAGAVTEDTVT